MQTSVSTQKIEKNVGMLYRGSALLSTLLPACMLNALEIATTPHRHQTIRKLWFCFNLAISHEEGDLKLNWAVDEFLRPWDFALLMFCVHTQ